MAPPAAALRDRLGFDIIIASLAAPLSVSLSASVSALLPLPSPTRPTSTGGRESCMYCTVCFNRLPIKGRTRGPRRQRGQQATRSPTLIKTALTRLIRCPGVRAIHYSAAPSDRPSFSPPFIHRPNYSVICFESAARDASRNDGLKIA